jgi:hypothetical protein
VPCAFSAFSARLLYLPIPNVVIQIAGVTSSPHPTDNYCLSLWLCWLGAELLSFCLYFHYQVCCPNLQLPLPRSHRKHRQESHADNIVRSGATTIPPSLIFGIIAGCAHFIVFPSFATTCQTSLKATFHLSKFE